MPDEEMYMVSLREGVFKSKLGLKLQTGNQMMVPFICKLLGLKYVIMVIMVIKGNNRILICNNVLCNNVEKTKSSQLYSWYVLLRKGQHCRRRCPTCIVWPICNSCANLMNGIHISTYYMSFFRISTHYDYSEASQQASDVQ